MKKIEFILTFDNKEIFKSMYYSLERKFRDVNFQYNVENNSIIAECSTPESEPLIKELIDFYNKSFSKVCKKINSKIMWENSQNTSSHNFFASQFKMDLPGVIHFGQEHTELINLLDEIFKTFFLKLGAVEISVASLISKKNLERCKYLPRDSHQICQLNSLYSSETQACLSPAACLPLYPALENHFFKDESNAFTFKSNVYRYEGGVFSDIPLERNWEYQIREFVEFFSGNENEVILEKYSEFMNSFCYSLNLPSRFQTASDTFFHEESSKMITHQLLMSKKFETVFLPDTNKEIALSSINFHDSFFTDEFNIKAPKQSLKSLCIGIGLFRILKAIIDINQGDSRLCKNLLTVFQEKQNADK